MAVLEAATSTDSTATALVDAALRDAAAIVRATALGALVTQGRLSTSNLLDGLRDDDPVVRRRAAQLAGAARDTVDEKTLTTGLLELLGDQDPLCAVAALVSLGDRSASAALDAISELARSSGEPLVVEEAIAALGSIGDPRSLAVVLGVIPTAKPALRRRCVAALGGFDGPEVESALDTLAEDRDWQVRQAVAMLRRDG
jgi:HEAT repeat protein